jgi:hypothetical protein
MTDSAILTAAYTLSSLTALTGTVSIDGSTIKTGYTLTANTGSLGGSGGTIAYQWKQGGSDISGATNAAYTLVAADEGQTITVTVSRSGYSGSVTGGPTSPVAGYIIGDTGPAGGKIFYVDNGTYGSGAWKYLEAATADIAGNPKWSSGPTYDSQNITGTLTAIGTGKDNTDAILAIDSDAPAAKACADLIEGGKDDWFLPSKDELADMYDNRVAIGGFTSSTYLSSSQQGATLAWACGFNNGNTGTIVDKTSSTRKVRAIRSF